MLVDFFPRKIYFRDFQFSFPRESSFPRRIRGSDQTWRTDRRTAQRQPASRPDKHNWLHRPVAYSYGSKPSSAPLTICPPTIMPISWDIMLLNASWLPICGARVGVPVVPVADDDVVVVVEVGCAGLAGLEAVVVVVVVSPVGEVAVVEGVDVVVVEVWAWVERPCIPDSLKTMQTFILIRKKNWQCQ